MNKKFLIVLTLLIFILSAAACSNKTAGKGAKSSNAASETKTTGTNGTSTGETKNTQVQDVKKEDDKIIQEAITTMDNLKLDEINDGILNDSELDSILKDKDDPIADIPTK